MPEGTPSNTHSNGWDEWGKHVLEEMRRLSKSQDDLNEFIAKVEHNRQEDYKELRKDFAQLCTDVAINKTKIAIISAISGFVAGGIMSIILGLVQQGSP